MIIRDIKYGFNTLVKCVILFIVLLGIPVSITIIAGNAMNSLHNTITVWPSELLAVCGITSMYSKPPVIMPFYMMLIILNIIAMCICVTSNVVILTKDEEKGLMQYYINQPYSRGQIFGIKMILVVVFSVLQWFVYNFLVVVSIEIICKMRNLPFKGEIGEVYDNAFKGIVFLIFLVSIGVLYQMKKGLTSVGSYFAIICTFSYVIGNMYKIFDLVGYYMRMALVNDDIMIKISELTIRFRILFPFTLLNVLNTESEPLPDVTYWLYGLASGVMIVLCGYVYRKKNFAE